jgi:hypothetical protein
MFPWKDFLMGQIRKIQKQKEERDRSGKFKKNKKERMEERKRRDFILFYFKSVEVPILLCSPTVENAFGLPPSCDPPSGEPTRMGTSLTT